MFFRFNFNIQFTLRRYCQQLKSFHIKNSYGNNVGRLGRFAMPLLGIGYLMVMPSSYNLSTQNQNKQNILVKEVNNQTANKYKHIEKRSIVMRIWHILSHIIRFFHLMLIFTPPLILLPLLMFKRTQEYWMDTFVKSVERAGVVFIKAFQYLSHRRDIIGVDLALKFEHLRENAPTHSFQDTKKLFKKCYNREILQIFEQFDVKPIASGSVSQVYKGKYKGKKVAVKVRHPSVEQYIERDVNLMFFFSYIASFFSPSMQIPVSQHSLKQTLNQQIDFTFQMKNLNKFNQMFKERLDINFPYPIQEDTKDAILIETFVQGLPVTYYENNRHPLNKVIARLGSTTFFEMLMKYNFIHADCHGGNILIQIRQKYYNTFTQIKSYLYELYFSLQTKIKSWSFDEQKIKKLYLESRQEELSILKLVRKYKDEIIVNLIDVGMVIQLNQVDKRNFVNFIKSVIEGRGQLCAQMIYKLSNFEGQKILMGSFQSYYSQLKQCFSILENQALDDLKGFTLFADMLTIIRQNRMKLDGQFATLLTNMIVLQAIAKDIDPEINILKCAFPYFHYVQGLELSAK